MRHIEVNRGWHCPDNCKKIPWYDKEHWGNPLFVKGYECPDDLGGDEPCPIGILDEDELREEKQMGSFKDMWNTAAKEETKSFQGEDLPEGTYNAEVLVCKIEPTKAGDKQKVAWDLRVVQGDYKNRHIFVNRSFSQTDESEQNQKNIKRAIDDFKLLGLPCDADVIAKTMNEVVGKIIELRIKNGNTPGTQFQNFLRIVEGNTDAKTDDNPF